VKILQKFIGDTGYGYIVNVELIAKNSNKSKGPSKTGNFMVNV